MLEHNVYPLLCMCTLLAIIVNSNWLCNPAADETFWNMSWYFTGRKPVTPASILSQYSRDRIDWPLTIARTVHGDAPAASPTHLILTSPLYVVCPCVQPSYTHSHIAAAVLKQCSAVESNDHDSTRTRQEWPLDACTHALYEVVHACASVRMTQNSGRQFFTHTICTTLYSQLCTTCWYYYVYFGTSGASAYCSGLGLDRLGMGRVYPLCTSVNDTRAILQAVCIKINIACLAYTWTCTCTCIYFHTISFHYIWSVFHVSSSV